MQPWNCKISVSGKRKSILRRKRKPDSAAPALSGVTEGSILGGLLHHSRGQLQRFCGVGGLGSLMIRGIRQAFFNGFQRQARTRQDNKQVLLGNGTISRVNQFPPAPNRLLYLDL